MWLESDFRTRESYREPRRSALSTADLAAGTGLAVLETALL
jgi:hypothetical protein